MVTFEKFSNFSKKQRPIKNVSNTRHFPKRDILVMASPQNWKSFARFFHLSAKMTPPLALHLVWHKTWNLTKNLKSSYFNWKTDPFRQGWAWQ